MYLYMCISSIKQCTYYTFDKSLSHCGRKLTKEIVILLFRAMFLSGMYDSLRNLYPLPIQYYPVIDLTAVEYKVIFTNSGKLAILTKASPHLVTQVLGFSS